MLSVDTKFDAALAAGLLAKTACFPAPRWVALMLFGLASVVAAPAFAGPQAPHPVADTTSISPEYGDAYEARFMAACQATDERASCQRRLESHEAELGFDGFAHSVDRLASLLAAKTAQPSIIAVAPSGTAETH